MQYTKTNSPGRRGGGATRSASRALIELDPFIKPSLALPDQIYASLKHSILSCKLLPGQRLIEQELCAEMGASRTPLREALNRLAHAGLVSLRPYRGYIVAPITLEDIRSLSELRRIVEGESAALCAKRATTEDCRRLFDLAELRYTPGDRKTYRSYLRANSAFHMALVRCTRNARLEEVVISVLDQLQRPLYLGLDVGIDAKNATAEHLEIVAAVRKRDAARARRAMQDQIEAAEKRILAAVSAFLGALEKGQP